jgi:mycofactocin system transcriptional regulator
VSTQPTLTSVEAIEKVALELFAAQGFRDTPVEEIAAAAGISRRTFFRYFPSKNDILFGDFERLLRDLDEWLSSAPDDRPMFDVIADGVLLFNRVHSDGPAAHRERMELILRTPALRANYALRSADWLTVVGRYAARRMDMPVEALGPQLAAHVSLGAANAAYSQWLHDPDSDLLDLVPLAFRTAQILPTLEVKSRSKGPSSSKSKARTRH